MMRRLYFLLAALFLTSPLVAQEQGSVTGVVVSSWDGSTLTGVIITIRGTTLAAQTDPSGRYQLNNVPLGDHVLRFSKPGFAGAVVTDVRVLPGQTTTVNGNLRPEFYEMEEYEVTAEEFTEQTEKIMFDRQRASSMIEAIGSEQFSRLGAGDAGAIVARVTGVSLVGGKYAVVRGLSDRYTTTLLNGLEVPSSDPYRTAPQLDLFPSAMIDRIDVSKTFTPDAPGASGGGTINIVTKPFPEKAFAKASVGISYNPNSNLRDDFLTDPKSSMAMLTLPESPKPLEESLWDLNDATRPDPGRIGTSPASERQTNATRRLNLANDVASLLQALGRADFGGVKKSSPLNDNLAVSAGDTLQLFDRPLGVFGGANYARNFRMLDEYEVARVRGETVTRAGKETRSNIGTEISSSANFGYQISDNHQIGFNFMLTQSMDEEARKGIWTRGESITDGDRQEHWQLHFTDRQVQNYQLHGHHDFPGFADSRLDISGSFALTGQSEPDHRFIDYTVQADGTPQFGANNLPIPFPSRYFREIEDQSVNVRADWSTPLSFFKEESKIKFGIWNTATERDFQEQYFRYDLVSGFDPANPNSYLNEPSYLNYTTTDLGTNSQGVRRVNYNFSRFVRTINGDPYKAAQTITAGYPMLDLGVLSWLRLVGGVRIERTLMEIEPRDRAQSGIDQIDFLPAASAIVKLGTNFNLRVGYSQTIARPSFREKADFPRNFLPDLGVFAEGNTNLVVTDVYSYDARIEWFPSAGDLISFGYFTKSLSNPIELYEYSFDGSLRWENRAAGRVQGIEIELRKNLQFIDDSLEGITLGANIALISSRTRLFQDEYQFKTNYIGGVTRPLYDQSPYIINLDLGYDHPTSGTSITLAANLTGERIVVTTSQGNDVYEHPPVTVDALISQKIGKNMVVRAGIRNILDDTYRQTYGEKFNDQLRQSYRRGRVFSLSVGADF